jgi:copper chaperone CopZ
MPRMTLYAPAVTCDHCIATIRETADGVPGAHFVSGDAESKSFLVDVEDGAALDQLAAALAAADYPLGDPSEPEGEATDHPIVSKAGWRPQFRVTQTDRGADVNYACYCGCEAGFALDRSVADAAPEGCCCGNRILAGREAQNRLRAAIEDASEYELEVETVTMPWGQPIEVALAVPRG